MKLRALPEPFRGFQCCIYLGCCCCVLIWSGSLRPADWFERDAELRDFPNGLCVDLTIVTGGQDGLDRAVKRKYEKYSDWCQQRPGLGFQVAGITTGGACSLGMSATLARWARRRAARSVLHDVGQTNADQEVRATFARGFVTLMATQARLYWRECTERDRGMRRPSRSTRTGVPPHPSSFDPNVDTFLRSNAQSATAHAAVPLSPFVGRQINTLDLLNQLTCSDLVPARSNSTTLNGLCFPQGN